VVGIGCVDQFGPRVRHAPFVCDPGSPGMLGFVVRSLQ
jgi:hypothetical protein